MRGDLTVHVVVVSRGEDLDIPHHLQHVQALLHSLGGEVVLHGVQVQPEAGRLPHLSVGLPVVERHGGEVVEGLLQVSLHPLLHTEPPAEDVERSQVEEWLEVHWSVSEGIPVVQLEAGLFVYRQSQLRLNLPSERADDLLLQQAGDGLLHHHQELQAGLAAEVFGLIQNVRKVLEGTNKIRQILSFFS